MILTTCRCGASIESGEYEVNQLRQCPECGGEWVCVSAEALGEGNGTADFDAALLVTSGPGRVGESCYLGGCEPIEIGKLPERPIALPGKLVSRYHCRLVRVDFGPSRWLLEDQSSTNGSFVNGKRIASQELQHGDKIRVGEYELIYSDASAAAAAAAETVPSFEPVAAAGGRECPSCAQSIGARAKICVPCGIHIDSGRPLLTSTGLDENAIYENTRNVLSVVSWLVPFTPLPIPVASEAYGKHRPYAIWAIAAITIIVSAIFALAGVADKGAGKDLMLWPSSGEAAATADTLLRDNQRLLPPNVDREQLRQRLIQELERNAGEFHWYQLFTHALLHDRSSILGFILHLGGNTLFLFVFGTRVNSIIGNLATAIVYPILAAAAASLYLMTLPHDHLMPMLGASGAIMGLAGMYLVLFPLHRVYCAMWIRIRLVMRLKLKIFKLRGFWVLSIYFAYDTIMVIFGSHGGVAHWAHIGGFLTGATLGFALLASRLFNCRNGDLLSVCLGKHAWPLIGKPSQWRAVAPAMFVPIPAQIHA